MSTLPCEDGGGSLNNPNGTPSQLGTNNPALKPYVAPDLNIGSWEISGLSPDACANNDQRRQEEYVAQALNISGAPINVYKLLGVHEQANGSLLPSATIISSTPSPGYPVGNIGVGGSWKSIETGTSTVATSFIGMDFGILQFANGTSQYEPKKSNLTKIGSLRITQANTPNEYARQVKVEVTTGKCEIGAAQVLGSGDGALQGITLGSNATQCTVAFIAASSSTFDVLTYSPGGIAMVLGTAIVGQPFNSPVINATVQEGSVPFLGGDTIVVAINYAWQRVGIFNLIQSPSPQSLNLATEILVRAVRITPTFFTGMGSWEVLGLDAFESAQTDINNIQDLFFGENRDRDYSKEPLLLKVQYSPTDSMIDLSKFGLSMLDQYSFTASFATVVKLLGRPMVVGDIIEVIPEMQYDQNLKPIRKFLEVTDTSWASEGFSTQWKPTLVRFAAQQALPSQETRDIFGTLDTQKYLIADTVLTNGLGSQLDTTPLTQVEEIIKEAARAVPETGTDLHISLDGVPMPIPKPRVNAKGNPKPSTVTDRTAIYIEDGLPKDDSPYGEGFKLPEPTSAADGDYFRLYYPPEQKIPPRLYRFSALKNRWIFLETDRRGDYSSHKPSVRSILQSSTRQGLGKKTT